VKFARVCILLVLAVLLPLRGAVAAAMLCPMGESSVQGESATHHQGDHGPAGHDGHHEVDQAGAGHHAGGHDHGAHDACNLCAAFCSLTPFVGEEHPAVAPPDLTDVGFPALRAPAPSFVSGGQERPPRTI